MRHVLGADLARAARPSVRPRRLLLGGCLLLLVPSTASAGLPILLESYAGNRSREAAGYVDQLLATLGGEGTLRRGAALRQEIESHLSRGPESGATADPTRAVEKGRRHFLEGEFDAAISELEGARAALLNNVSRLASDQALRGTLYRGLLFLAHAYLRGKRGEKATERIGEVIRSFPDRDLSLVQTQFGPELVTLFRKVRNELGKQGRGTLVVTTAPPGCLVFLDERFVGVSPVRVVDLYAGRYRVYVQHQQRQGRVHEVTVRQGEQALRIHFELDSVLRTEPWVGFRFADLAAQDRSEARLAAELGQALDASSVLLVGFRPHQGRKALVGTTLSPITGRLRTAIVVVEPAPPSPTTISALGRFLLDGQTGEGLIIPSSPRAGPPPTDGGFFSARVFKWVTLGVAAACLASGITLLVLDGRGSCGDTGTHRCPETYNTLVPGAVLTAAGGLAAGGSGFLFYWDRRQRSARERASVAAALVPWLHPGSAAGLSAVVSY